MYSLETNCYNSSSLIKNYLYIYSGIPIKRPPFVPKKKCPPYGDVRFIECFPKTQSFSKI